MDLFRCLDPQHSLVHTVHSDQSANAQLILSTQETSTLQGSCSIDRPVAGFPHSSASIFTLRDRHLCPPLQVEEHASQSVQSPHLPSMHFPHGSVLHGSISSLAPSAHGAHPIAGSCAIRRWRTRCPPPHELLQLPQLDQALHLQSAHSHGVALHGPVCSRSALQPWAPSCARRARARWRSRWPGPQDALQGCQSDHELTLQSVVPGHASSAQPAVSTSCRPHCLPPPRGLLVTWRVRVV